MIGSKRSKTLDSPVVHSTFRKKPLAKHVRALLVSTLSLGSFVPFSVFAQEVSSDDLIPEDLIMEEIVVTGIRASQRGSMDLKKMAGTMSDAIVAEDVAKFPDKNVTESLQRVPGVQISRDFGEGAGISVRGMEARLTRVEFDGVTALGDGGRDISLTGTSSELVKVATVVKGSEARITEGGVGGTIQIEMRKPNDFEEDYFSVSHEQQYNDLSETTSPKTNITGVYKFTDDIGVMVNFNTSNKNTMIHAIRNTEWQRWADYDNSEEKTVVDQSYAFAQSAEECQGAFGANGSAPLPEAAGGSKTNALNDCRAQWYDFAPTTPRYGNWQREEKRTSGNIGFGWRINEELSLYTDYTLSERDKQALDYNLQLSTGSSGRIDADSVIVDDNHNVRAFTTANAEVTNRTLDFAWLQRKQMFKLGADYTADNFEVKGVIATSRTDQDIDSREGSITSNGVAGVRVALDGKGAPEFDLTSGYRYQDPDSSEQIEFEPFNVNDPASYNARARYKYQPIVEQQNEDSAKVDFSYNFDEGMFITKARTGARWAKTSLEGLTRDNNIIRDVGTSYNVTDWQGQPIEIEVDGEMVPVRVEWTQADQIAVITGATETTPDFFPSLDLGVGTIENYQAVNANELIERLERIASTSVNRNNIAAVGGAYYIEEETLAAYIQADFEQELGDMLLWGNAGVRYVQTDTEAEGDVVINTIYDTYTSPDGPQAETLPDPYPDRDDQAWIWNQNADGSRNPNAILDYNGDGVTNSLDQDLATDQDTGQYNPTVQLRTFNGRDSSVGSYDDVLPSVNVNLSVIPEVLNIYTGWSKVMARPAIDALNVDATCYVYATYRDLHDTTLESRPNRCDGGNPNLKPYRATQADLAVMWYPDEDTMVSGGIFTKQLTVYLGENVTTRDVQFFGSEENGDIIFDVTQPTNITGVTTKGIELQARTIFTYLPEPFDRMGADVNFTYTTADDVPYTSQLDGSELPLLGLSENSYNLTAFYEDDNWTVRLAYNFRDEYLVSTSDRGGNPVYVEGAGYLDGKVSYTFTDLGLTLFADAQNMLGEVKLETAGDARLTDLQWAGRTYALGISYKM